MPSPTYVTHYASDATTNTTPKTASVTVANGDVLVVVCVGDGLVSGSATFTPSGGTGLSYNSRAAQLNANLGMIQVFVAEVNADQSFTLSVADSPAMHWGFDAFRFANARDAVNATITRVNANATGAGYTTLTTATANSAVVCGFSDFDATPTTSYSWWEDGSASGTEVSPYVTPGGNYSYGTAYWPDAGTATSHTFGVLNNSNTFGEAQIAAVEIKYQLPGAAATPANAAPLYAPMWRRSLQLGR